MGHPIGITAREAANAYNVSPRTIRRWAQNGRIDAAKISGRWVITLDAPSLDGFKPEQVEKARDLIEQGLILPTSRPGLYTVVASDNVTTYLVHASGCTCPAGQRGKHRCYHRAAVAIVTAASAALTRRAA
ncbi:helix-turn-helix domain-containing protein [Nonomuraea sp. NPDC050643]|uniref:helix-turn-helix domain-containing protein n=1 Tax=Nonomuraea sp. NPDC050643 TaxID=3155660 RepID=UPI0033FA50B1